MAWSRLLIVLCLSGFVLTGCSMPPDAQRLDGATMGTTWSVQYVGDVAPQGLRAPLQAELDLVVTQMSTWETGSDISRFNRAAPGSWVNLPDELRAVLDHALALARDTDGAYDPTVGALVDLWGFGAHGTAAPPDDDAIAVARRQVGWQRLQRDAAAGTVLQPGGMQLDLSSIAKGFAVDRLCQVLDAHGVTDYLVEIGGELRARGRAADARPWTVAIESPAVHDSADGGARPLRTIALWDAAVATSGDYRRAAAVNGRTVSHEIDPHSGLPVMGALASVSVVRPAAMDADALATALFVLGAKEGAAFASARGIAALFTLRGDDGFTEEPTAAWQALYP